MNITVYTDGSTLNNQHKGKRKGGIGVFFADNDVRNKSIPLIESKDNKVTNQVSELTACLIAIQTIINNNNNNINNNNNNMDDNIVCFPIKKINITICTDSLYTINCISVWAKNWKKNNWKKRDGKIIENIELIQQIYTHYNDPHYNIVFRHVKAHTSEPVKDHISYNDWYGNMMADKLATIASMS
jgi:ribonuclease HI